MNYFAHVCELASLGHKDIDARQLTHRNRADYGVDMLSSPIAALPPELIDRVHDHLATPELLALRRVNVAMRDQIDAHTDVWVKLCQGAGVTLTPDDLARGLSHKDAFTRARYRTTVDACRAREKVTKQLMLVSPGIAAGPLCMVGFYAIAVVGSATLSVHDASHRRWLDAATKVACCTSLLALGGVNAVIWAVPVVAWSAAAAASLAWTAPTAAVFWGAARLRRARLTAIAPAGCAPAG